MPQRVQGSTEIAVPVETVYGYWETLENLPNFMANVEEVTPTGPDTTRWKVKGPLGTMLEWEARTTHKEPNSTIGWITNAGADVDNSGVVRFRESAPGATLVEGEPGSRWHGGRFCAPYGTGRCRRSRS